MKRTLLSLMVVGLFAGVGTSAIAEDVKAGSEPNANSRQMAPVETDSTTQAATSATQTKPARAEDAAPAKDFAGNSSDQPKDSKY